MNIGKYTFDEFKKMAEGFHGYAAPGLLAGAYMVEKAKSLLAQGELFEVLVETRRCLPDAVELLTPCTFGNGRLHAVGLGRFALTIFNKYDFNGFRVNIDLGLLAGFPEYKAWFLKEKSKQNQDEKLLLDEIENAGWDVFRHSAIKVKPELFKPAPMGPAAICQLCGEAYPKKDGDICLGCLEQGPYTSIN